MSVNFAFTAPAFSSGGGDFQPCPSGVFPARLYRLLDLGTQSETFEGKTSERRKLLLSFEILDPDIATDDGRPMSVHRRFTWSLHPKAALRPFLAAWRGKALTDDEAARFDFSKLLGAACLLNITHSERGDSIRSDIASISPIPKSMTTPPGVNPLVAFHAEHPDTAVLDSLGRGLREVIERSPEYRRAMGGGLNHQAPAPANRTPYPPPATSRPADSRQAFHGRRSEPTAPPPALEPVAEGVDFDDEIPF